MITQLVNSWVCWAILLLAIFCYQQLWQQYLLAASRQGTSQQTEQQADASRQFTGVLIGALPLLGLLGTIIGLLECFVGLAREGASGAVLSGGISDALLTTQLGLVCALPAWILQAATRAKMTRQQTLMLAR
ncbi:MotA/TolQ/ExbB proton channel family protein [Paraglaciecola hydrolytica]|uniref:MotA/TolQ/ExbB proton channel domain-containing protein n=1 Tax=Paraglaciecola hydrolytica TaxID=1799789 RepID=A0A148KN89_9ALTE|nr:MotA/TolQ/ExbB proton channel family protein [Paraglaciecola hydrolytica]KXI27705.1 hypothetical protein AX660_19325 [Paraglaciecola hydrolytica]